MPPTLQETYLTLHPINPDSLMHNTRQLSNIRSITSLLLGIAAGILGLESLAGFAFYFISQQLISSLFYFLVMEGDAERYFSGNVVKGGKTGTGKRTGAWMDVFLGGGLYATWNQHRPFTDDASQVQSSATTPSPKSRSVTAGDRSGSQYLYRSE